MNREHFYCFALGYSMGIIGMLFGMLAIALGAVISYAFFK